MLIKEQTSFHIDVDVTVCESCILIYFFELLDCLKKSV